MGRHLEKGKPCHDNGEQHDCEYVDWRNTLVPVAETVANMTAGSKPEEGETAKDWAKRWDYAFHAEMKRLTTDPLMLLGSAGTGRRLAS